MSMLQQITENNHQLDRHTVGQILIIYEEQEFFIGDSCIMFDKLKACKLFFPNAAVTINFSIQSYLEGYRAILQANPNVDRISALPLEEIDYHHYDAVFCVTDREEMLFNVIAEKCSADVYNGTFRTAIFSFSRQVIDHLQQNQFSFPSHEAFVSFAGNDLGPMELFIDDEEKSWANNWLLEKGLGEHENLLVLLDSTSVKTKLLPMPVYYEMLMALLKYPDIKILIFDEKNIGKEAFYKQLLGATCAQQFIFANGLDLRKAITLLAADKVKLIFGPCTGLMHCASGLYNNFLRKGLERSRIPLMVTYTGKYHKPNENAHYWWNNAPLMNCLMIRQNNGLREMTLLRDLPEQEQQATNNTLDCTAYTAKMILGFLEKHLALQKAVSV